MLKSIEKVFRAVKILNQITQTEFRQQLRRKQTDAEMLFWSKVRNKQLEAKFFRQYGIGKYIVDFCCPRMKLIIELDGGHHYDTRVEYDLIRDEYLKFLNYKVLRFSNLDILKILKG